MDTPALQGKGPAQRTGAWVRREGTMRGSHRSSAFRLAGWPVWDTKPAGTGRGMGGPLGTAGCELGSHPAPVKRSPGTLRLQVPDPEASCPGATRATPQEGPHVGKSVADMPGTPGTAPVVFSQLTAWTDPRPPA